MKKLFALAFAAILLVAFNVPAMAKTHVGGVMMLDWFYYTQDEENQSGGVAQGASATDDDWGQLRMNLPQINQLRIKWTNEHNVGMYLESGMGWGSDTGGGSYTQNYWHLREFYGWWDASPNFQLMAGQKTTPFSPLAPAQRIGTSVGHIIGIGYGNFYTGRFPQVRGTFKFSDSARLAVALLDGTNKSTSPFPDEAANKKSDNDTSLPRIDIGAPIYVGPVKLYPSVFYQKATFDNVASGSDDEIVSYGLSMGIKAGFGPVTISAEYQQGQNWGDLAYSSGGLGAYVSSAGKVEDADNRAYWIDVGFKAGPAQIDVMYGAQKNELDPPGTANDYDQEKSFYGVSASIPLSKIYVLRPEIMFYDKDDSAKVGSTKVDFGKEAIYGVQWMIMF